MVTVRLATAPSQGGGGSRDHVFETRREALDFVRSMGLKKSDYIGRFGNLYVVYPPKGGKGAKP